MAAPVYKVRRRATRRDWLRILWEVAIAVAAAVVGATVSVIGPEALGLAAAVFGPLVPIALAIVHGVQVARGPVALSISSGGVCLHQPARPASSVVRVPLGDIRALVLLPSSNAALLDIGVSLAPHASLPEGLHGLIRHSDDPYGVPLDE